MKYPGTGLLDTIEECVASMKSKPTTVTITFAPGEIPKGFRLTGEWEYPDPGELHIDPFTSRIERAFKRLPYKAFILERIPRRKLPQKKRKGKKSKP